MPLTGPEIVSTWFEEVWNKGRAEAIDEYAAPDWVSHGMDLPGDATLSPRDRFKLLYKGYKAAFPDLRITVESAIAEGEMVAAHCSVRGTHKGPGLHFDATDLPVDFIGVLMVRCRDGKIVESWESWNFLSMYTQLGQSLT